MSRLARVWWSGPMVPALEPAWRDGLVLHAERQRSGLTRLADGQGGQRALLVDPLRHASLLGGQNVEVWHLERDGTPEEGVCHGVVLWGRPNQRVRPLAAALQARGFAAGLRCDLVLGRTEAEASDRADAYSDQYAPDEAAASALLGALAKPPAPVVGSGIPRGSYLVEQGTTWVGPGSPGVTGGRWSYTFIGTPAVVAKAIREMLSTGVELCYAGGSAADAELLPDVLAILARSEAR